MLAREKGKDKVEVMNLTEEQTEQVRSWVEAGAGLAEVQRKLESELGVKSTFLETRFLVDDLKLSIQSPTPPPELEKATDPAPTKTGQLVDSHGQPAQSPEAAEQEAQANQGTASVSVSLDELTIPGALVSGKVSFSDGESGRWYLDQMGRMGFEGTRADYRPSEEDLSEFQLQLQELLQKQGL